LNNQDYLKDFLPTWVKASGEASDVTISSRIRLARNIKGIPFPNFADEKQLIKVNEEVLQAIKEKPPFGPLALIKVEELTPDDRNIYVVPNLQKITI
jgi:protein arginine kinase